MEQKQNAGGAPSSADIIFEGLNPAQRHAVSYGIDPGNGTPPPLLIAAGAGTGKTKTLAHRVARLILGGLDPRRLLLLTFTRRAALELTRRAQQILAARRGRTMIGAEAELLPWSGTFHSIGNRLLRQYAAALALNPAFTVRRSDETTMVYNWICTRKSAPLSDEDRVERAIGNGPEHVDQTTFRSKANRDNAYLIDRAVQKTETFTGIDGINVQDRAIQESMGPICDRSREHLGPADKGIIQMRRLLREAINTVRAGGTPAGVAPSYYDLYCALQVLPRNADWRQILAPTISSEKILQTV